MAPGCTHNFYGSLLVRCVVSGTGRRNWDATLLLVGRSGIQVAPPGASHCLKLSGQRICCDPQNSAALHFYSTSQRCTIVPAATFTQCCAPCLHGNLGQSHLPSRPLWTSTHTAVHAAEPEARPFRMKQRCNAVLGVFDVHVFSAWGRKTCCFEVHT